MQLRRTGWVALLLVLALAVAACGGKKEQGGNSTNVVEIVVELGRSDWEFAFNPSEIELKVNQRVRLVAKNVGTVAHDLHIPDLNVHIDPVPPGGQKAVEFVPNKTGEFSMECHEPGHLQSGMVGKVRVVS